MVHKIGYVDEFLHEYPDHIAHFREQAKRLTQEAKQREVTLTFSLDKHVSFDGGFDKAEFTSLEKADRGYKYGIRPLLQLYRELQIDYFLRIRAQYRWVDWFNNRRILAPIENILPAEYEHMYYAGDMFLPIAAELT